VGTAKTTDFGLSSEQYWWAALVRCCGDLIQRTVLPISRQLRSEFQDSIRLPGVHRSAGNLAGTNANSTGVLKYVGFVLKRMSKRNSLRANQQYDQQRAENWPGSSVYPVHVRDYISKRAATEYTDNRNPL
jgi:hypothetical protein